MTTQTNTARPLYEAELDYINYSDVHRHDPRKIIPFTAAAATKVHPSMAARHRRLAQRYARQSLLLVAIPRVLSVVLLCAFLYLRLALFADAPFGGLNLLWVGAYALAGCSIVFSHLLKPPASNHA